MDTKLKWHLSFIGYHREGFDTWPLATFKILTMESSLTQIHPPEMTPLYNKEVWTTLCHAMEAPQNIGF